MRDKKYEIPKKHDYFENISVTEDNEDEFVRISREKILRGIYKEVGSDSYSNDTVERVVNDIIEDRDIKDRDIKEKGVKAILRKMISDGLVATGGSISQYKLPSKVVREFED